MRVHFLICVLIFLMGCQSPSGSEVKVYKFGDEFDLKLREKAVIGTKNGIVEFVDVLQDTRCPSNVNCIWAGNAEVKIRFIQTNTLLNTYLEPKDTTISNMHIQLLRLEPYPALPRQFEKEDYNVRLLITKK